MDNTPASALDLSIVVPVYRSEAILPHLVEKIASTLSAVQPSLRFELILVNDASPDGSWEVIERLAASHIFVKGICLMKNVGQHNAIMAGLSMATGEVIVMMDDDLQHPPDAIAAMISAIQGGYDVCYTKYANRQHALWKKAGSWFNDRVATWLLQKPKGLYLSSFKALHRRVAKEIVKYDGPYAYIDGLVLDITRKITAITIQHQARYEGKSNYNMRRLFSLWLKMVTSFSILPLRIASAVGAMTSVVSIFLIGVVILQKLLHPEIAAGWASLAALILFMGGIQLFALGIMGEYVGRTYLKINHKPQYVIRTVTCEVR